jgi:RNA polymerase sigma-70 factor, ECF subfamily
MVMTGEQATQHGRPPSRHGRAFDDLFLAHYERLVRSLTLICGDREVAADCVADAFERAFVRWRRVGRLEDPVGWVRRVAINRARDVHRRHRRRDRAVERLAGRRAGPDTAPEPTDAGLLAAVSDLPTQQRTVVALHYLEDLSVADVADAMDLSEGAVKYHLHQARARLRASVPADEGMPAAGRQRGRNHG